MLRAMQKRLEGSNYPNCGMLSQKSYIPPFEGDGLGKLVALASCKEYERFFVKRSFL